MNGNEHCAIDEIVVVMITYDTETARYGDAARLGVELTKIFASVRFSHILDP